MCKKRNSWGDKVDTFGKCKNPIRRPSPNEFGGGSEREMIKTLVDQVNHLTGLLEMKVNKQEILELLLELVVPSVVGVNYNNYDDFDEDPDSAVDHSEFVKKIEQALKELKEKGE